METAQFTFPPPKTHPFGKNSQREITQSGRFYAVRYHGQFSTLAMQTRAATGFWYCYATGIPASVAQMATGEGSTPEKAFADMQRKARDIRDNLTLAFQL